MAIGLLIHAAMCPSVSMAGTLLHGSDLGEHTNKVRSYVNILNGDIDVSEFDVSVRSRAES